MYSRSKYVELVEEGLMEVEINLNLQLGYRLLEFVYAVSASAGVLVDGQDPGCPIVHSLVVNVATHFQ